MKVIGIITLYYKNYNLGGLLQAYALPQILNKYGVKAEQLCIWHYDQSGIDLTYRIKRKILTLLKDPVYVCLSTLKKRKNEQKYKSIEDSLQNRWQIMQSFMKIIPHSNEVYDLNNISSAVDKYDEFLVGSDQVWNEDLFVEDYLDINLLNFVPKNYTKIAYAVSFGKSDNYTAQFKKKLLKALKSFDAISIREKNALEFLKKLNCKNCEIVLDPTLLLEADDWKQLIKLKKTITEKYMFVYFIGEDVCNRETAKKIADNNNLKIIVFAHVNNHFCYADENFGDEQILEYGPVDFLQYIYDSSLVVTDSFHACVFSMIFNKDFFALKRDVLIKKGDMNQRLYDLLDEYDMLERLVLDQKNIEKVPLRCDFKKFNQTIQEKRVKSIDFLLSNLKK